MRVLPINPACADMPSLQSPMHERMEDRGEDRATQIMADGYS
jgi:hypothetical protein